MNISKKAFSKTLCVLLTAVLLVGTLASCMGESAYDIAVRNGFEGDEEEWLESLRGDNGKDGKDGKDGINGENGKDGVDGKDGKDGKDGLSVGNDASAAASIGLRSAVSVFSFFEKTEYAGYGREPNVTTYISAGAGVIYKLDKSKGDAYIITNYHVVYDKSSNTSDKISKDIKLYLYGQHYDEKEISAQFIGGSMNYDIAILKVSGSEVLKNSDVLAVTLVDSDRVAAGSMAVAVGNPESGGISVTSGVISVDSEYVDIASPKGSGTIEMRVMRIDTPVNHGNSGGGLFDANGRLIGIVNAKTEKEGIDDFGYAIPANVVYAATENIIHNYEKAGRSGLYKATIGMGIQLTDSSAVFDPEKMQTLICDNIVVSEVTAGSASDGVFKAGDKLISMSCGDLTRDVRRLFTPIDFILALSEGDEITFKIERDGEIITLSIVLKAEYFSKIA